jgi:hypothetical protein
MDVGAMHAGLRRRAAEYGLAFNGTDLLSNSRLAALGGESARDAGRHHEYAMGMFAAYFAAEKLVAPLAAVAAPLGLAMVFGMTVWHPVRLLWAEVWAAPFVVAAAALAALVLWSAEAGGRTRAWLLAGAGGISALAALLCRELALVPILIMGLALLLSPKVRRAYLWTPWLAAVLAWAAQYAWQVQEVRTLTAELPAIKPNWSLADYFFNGPEQLFAAIRWASSEIYVVAFVAIFCIMAAAAAFTVQARAVEGALRIRRRGSSALDQIGELLLVGICVPQVPPPHGEDRRVDQQAQDEPPQRQRAHLQRAERGPPREQQR